MLKFKLLSEDATLPTRATTGSAGLDLYASEETSISSGSRRVVKTDLSLAVPMGTYARIAPRSGLAFKHGIDYKEDKNGIGKNVIEDSQIIKMNKCVLEK